jgi:hypothetical protein
MGDDRQNPALAQLPAVGIAVAAARQRWIDQGPQRVIHDPRLVARTLTNSRIVIPDALAGASHKIVLRAPCAGAPKSLAEMWCIDQLAGESPCSASRQSMFPQIRGMVGTGPPQPQTLQKSPTASPHSAASTDWASMGSAAASSDAAISPWPSSLTPQAAAVTPDRAVNPINRATQQRIAYMIDIVTNAH